MDLDLKKKNVLITGSSQGIGRAIAVGFLAEGANVIITGRDEVRLNQARQDLMQQFGEDVQVHAYAGDLCEQEQLAALVDYIDKKGGVDHLVCNIGCGKSVPVLQEDLSEWERMLSINLASTVACVSNFLPSLKVSAQNAKHSVSITAIASICGVEALGCPVAYATAKAGLLAYIVNMSRQLGPAGIRINAVSPGNVLFPGSTWEDKLKRDEAAVKCMLKNEVPLQRLASAEEIANIVIFLASNKASFVTGANWVVDGGQTRGI